MKILCPTDFSDTAMRAADVAAAFAQKAGSPLCLVHCAVDPVVTSEMPIIASIDEHAREKLEAEASRLRQGGIEVRTDLRHGQAADQIVHAAEEDSVDLIVIGSMGRSAAARWLIGSVAARVAESAPARTLVVRAPDVLIGWLKKGVRLKLLCGVDFTVSADAALAAVRDFSALGPCSLDAAFVEHARDEFTPFSGDPTHPLAPTEANEKGDRERDVWERVRAHVGDMDVSAHVHHADTRLDYEFVRMADELGSGMIVVGTHQRHGFRRLTAQSFSRGTLSNAETNVLCVPLSTYKPEFRVPPVQRVLVATDFSDTAHDALRFACALAGTGGAVRIVHVCRAPTAGLNPLIGGRVYLESSEDVEREKAAAVPKLQALLPNAMATSGVRCDSQVLAHHDAAAAICEAAEHFGAHVICLGTHGHSVIASLALGSVAQNVVSSAHIPVLVVPRPGL